MEKGFLQVLQLQQLLSLVTVVLMTLKLVDIAVAVVVAASITPFELSFAV